MIRISVCFGLIAFFIGAWAGVSSAQDEVFSISQKLGLGNLNPKVAVDPATGDIVVAWVQMNSKTDNRDIYAAYCKYLGDGKFKAGKPRLVSQVKGRNDPPDIAFDQAAKSYLIVWARLEWFSAISKAYNILARRTNSTGRLKGKEVHITDSKVGYSEQPLIMSMDSATGAPAGSGGYLIFFVHYPIYATEMERGLNAVGVDAKGRKTGEPQNIFNPMTVSNKTGEVWLYDVAGGNGGNFIIPLVDVYSDDTSDTWLAEIDPSGQGGKAGKVADEMLRGPSVSALSSKLYLLTWTKSYEADFYHQRYRAGLKKVKKQFTSAGEYSYYQIAGLELDGGGAYLIAADQNRLDVSRFSAKGKQIGVRETRTVSVYFGSSFDCLLLPDGKCLFVTSRNLDAGQENYEVYGFTLDLE